MKNLLLLFSFILCSTISFGQREGDPPHQWAAGALGTGHGDPTNPCAVENCPDPYAPNLYRLGYGGLTLTPQWTEPDGGKQAAIPTEIFITVSVRDLAGNVMPIRDNNESGGVEVVSVPFILNPFSGWYESSDIGNTYYIINTTTAIGTPLYTSFDVDFSQSNPDFILEILYCDDDDCIPVVNQRIGSTSQESNLSSELICYPNPAQDRITFDVANPNLEPTSGQILIFDMNGKEVRNESITLKGLTHAVSVGELKAGMYLIQLQYDENSNVGYFTKID